jgi:hypothetical protein
MDTPSANPFAARRVALDTARRLAEHADRLSARKQDQSPRVDAVLRSVRPLLKRAAEPDDQA